VLPPTEKQEVENPSHHITNVARAITQICILGWRDLKKKLLYFSQVFEMQALLELIFTPLRRTTNGSTTYSIKTFVDFILFATITAT
jgi:hypothetical protein